MVRELIPWSDMLPADDVMRAIKRHVLGPYRCGTLTHDNVDTALLSHPQASISGNTGLNWSGDVTWTPGGTAIIRGEKPESTHSGLNEQDDD